MNSVELRSGCINVNIDGRFDYQSGLDCISEILALTDHPSRVHIDFKLADYIDSSGIGALFELRNRMPENSPSIELANPSGSVLRVFKQCHLQKIFDIVSDDSESIP